MYLCVRVHEHFCKNISNTSKFGGTENVAGLEVSLQPKESFLAITPKSTSTVGNYISYVLEKKMVRKISF